MQICVGTLLEAITFDQTVGFPISLEFWKLDIQSFLGTPRSAESKYGKISKHASKSRPEKARIANVSRGGRRCLCGRQASPAATQRPSKAEGSESGYKGFQTPYFCPKKEDFG